MFVPYLIRAESSIRSGNVQAAIKDLKRAIAVNPENAESYALLGMAYEKTKDNLQAILSYNNAIEVNRQFEFAYISRDRLYKNLLKDYQRKIRNAPDNINLYVNRGNVHAIMKKQQEALEDYSRAIDLNSGISAVYFNRGLVYRDLGRYKEAMDDFDRVINLAPQDAQAYYNRGIIFKKTGDSIKASRDFQIASKLGSKEALRLLEK